MIKSTFPNIYYIMFNTDDPMNINRETLKKAYEIKWLHNETAWLQMLKDRNETSHAYDEKMAKRIYDDICKNMPHLQKAFQFLENRFKS